MYIVITFDKLKWFLQLQTNIECILNVCTLHLINEIMYKI